MILLFCFFTDLLHLLKISLLCDLFFVLKKRESKIKYIIAVTIMILTSISIYVSNNDLIETLIYTIAICISMCILYVEKRYLIIISALWIILITSMLDAMSTVFVQVFADLSQIKYNYFFEFLASTVSLVFVLIVGKIYSNKYKVGINRIEIVNIIAFTILMVVDTFIVLVMAVITIDEMAGIYKYTYSIALVCAILGIFLQLAVVILLFMQRNIYREKKHITEKYLNDQKKHYEYLERRERETKKFRHDLRNHMQMLSVLNKNGEYEEFNNYLQEINIRIDNFESLITVHNGIVDAIINQYYSEALKKGIDMKVSGSFPKGCEIEAYDLCTIFSNILSNALEAANTTEKKIIKLDCRYTEESVIIVVENTFNDLGQFNSDNIRTNKSDLDYHGYGLENIKDSVERNNGILDIEINNGVFHIMIMLNYKERAL